MKCIGADFSLNSIAFWTNLNILCLEPSSSSILKEVVPAVHLFRLLKGSTWSFIEWHHQCFECYEERLVLQLEYSSYLGRALKLTAIR